MFQILIPVENTCFFCDGCDNDSDNRTSQSVSILWSCTGIYELHVDIVRIPWKSELFFLI